MIGRDGNSAAMNVVVAYRPQQDAVLEETLARWAVAEKTIACRIVTRMHVRQNSYYPCTLYNDVRFIFR